MVIDNSERLAPAQFNTDDTLEISRRITRDIGSAFTVNGKHVREMVLDSGSLVLRQGMPSTSIGGSDVFPLSKLKAVTVDHREGVILKGEFDRFN